jgi:hypothetical protein
MTKLFLSLHVLAVIIAVGPVTVAASMFSPALRRAQTDPEATSTVHVLHRICRVYALVGFAVPVFGFATASSLGVLGSPWLIASIILTGAAAAVLAFVLLPGQARAIDGLHVAGGGGGVGVRAAGRLAMYTGIFNLLWATVTVLMIVRPGSTTGA